MRGDSREMSRPKPRNHIQSLKSTKEENTKLGEKTMQNVKIMCYVVLLGLATRSTGVGTGELLHCT